MEFPKVRNWTGTQKVSIIQEKFDGYSVGIDVSVSGVITVTTRTGKTDLWEKIKKIPRLFNMIRTLPSYTRIFGELVAKDVKPTDLVTLLNNADPRLDIVAFQMPWKGGINLGDYDWYVVADKLHVIGFNTPPFKAYEGESLEYLKEKAKLAGIEGYVLKDGHCGKAYKVKPLRTVDCVVLDYTISSSDTHFGGLKAVQVGCEGLELASVGNGFSCEYRQSVDPMDLIGRVCEIGYDSMAGEKLKFPRFLRWREDKEPEQCLLDQVTS